MSNPLITLVHPIIFPYLESYDGVTEYGNGYSYSNVILREQLGPFFKGTEFVSLHISMNKDGTIHGEVSIDLYIPEYPTGTKTPDHYITNPILTQLDPQRYPSEILSQREYYEEYEAPYSPDPHAHIDITEYLPKIRLVALVDDTY